MRRLAILIYLGFLFNASIAQRGTDHARVVNAADRQPLAGANITIYTSGKFSSLVANGEGYFSMPLGLQFDSIKVSMIGFHSHTLPGNELDFTKGPEILLTPAPSELQEVVIRPLSAREIVEKAIGHIPQSIPGQDFENKGFYREIIGDSSHYYSLAEAVFDAQYFPSKKELKLKLERGRSEENVAYTRLFEDFHPGGGPQQLAGSGFVIGRPDFLDRKKSALFNYKLDSIVQYDEHNFYCIHFDQKPGVKEALEKGTMYIDTDDGNVLKFEAQNSPLGDPYVKNLTGTDKIFAELLHIDFRRKGWKQKVEFSMVNDKWVMSHAESTVEILYRQPKKDIDLDLTVSMELVMTDLMKPVEHTITKDEEWKRKNIVANLPTVFDPAFWGNELTISPTAMVTDIVKQLSISNEESPVSGNLEGWKYLNRNSFVSWQHNDTVTMAPVMKGIWEDDETSGLLYKELKGDFEMESDIRLMKNSNLAAAPDKGFQQAGLLVRSAADEKENYIFLSVGTSGNPNGKILFRKTIDNKSHTVIDKIDDMQGRMKLEKKGEVIAAYFKAQNGTSWKKIGECEAKWLSGDLQVGLAAYANFTGSGPKMQPDMRVEFSNSQLGNQ